MRAKSVASRRRANEKSRPRPGLPVWGVTVFAFLLMYVPLITLVLLSFRDDTGWTLGWYSKLAANQEILHACLLSLIIALASTAISCSLGTMAAYAVSRFRWPGRRIFSVFTHFPLIMPEIVMGLALLVWFVALRMTLGVVSVILAHVTFSVSYVILNVMTRLEELDPMLDEAARDLGATRAQTFWRVTFPLLRPAIASGGVMAFTLSFDDFLITFFVSGAGADTLPLKIYSMIKFGVSPEVNALSTLLLALTMTIVVAVTRLGGRSR
jgi:spermidine/putrescine transport system permease protein